MMTTTSQFCPHELQQVHVKAVHVGQICEDLGMSGPLFNQFPSLSHPPYSTHLPCHSTTLSFLAPVDLPYTYHHLARLLPDTCAAAKPFTAACGTEIHVQLVLVLDRIGPKMSVPI